MKDKTIKVLLVDDEPNILTSLSFLLSKENISTATAQNGKEAINQFKIFQPDVVLLDVMMPEMDGFAAAAEIRKIDKDSNTHIIFLTAKGTTADKITGYSKGGDDYVIKPFKNSEILEKIKEKAGLAL